MNETTSTATTINFFSCRKLLTVVATGADVALFGRAYDGRVPAAVGGGVRDI